MKVDAGASALVLPSGSALAFVYQGLFNGLLDAHTLQPLIINHDGPP